MDKIFFYKNNLGQEVDISRNFLYDGLKNLDEINGLENIQDIFSFLYNISVGIERIMKVAIVLLEFDDFSEIKEFEKSLVSYNHLSLLNRIQKKKKVNLKKVHIEFLKLLADFYKTNRYGRFTFDNKFDGDKEKLKDYVYDFLELEITDSVFDGYFSDEERDNVKISLGKVIGKISTKIYSVIRDKSSSDNIYIHMKLEVHLRQKKFL